MTTLKIKLDDIIEALTTHFDIVEGSFLLDAETGDILLKADDIDDLPEDLENNPRYLVIDPISSHESFQIMEDFVDNLGDTEEASHLKDALNLPKPFRRFKDTLCDYPELRTAWFKFEHQELARLAEEWCEENGIQAEWV